MALVSRHYKVAVAIRSALVADAELAAAIPESRWVIQKRAYHRNMAWEPGAYVVPVRRASPVHETQTLRIVLPVLVALVWPQDGDLVADLEAELAIGERIENIFTHQGRTAAPATLRALDTAFTGEDAMFYEMTTVQPGEPFMEGALQNGLDVIATLINVTVTAPKRNSSTLGA